MAYVNYQYYASGYLLGREPAVPEKLFPFFEKQARSEINKRTFGRIAADSTLITDEIKDCCCELVELLYHADSVAQQALQDGAPGPLVSFNNDGQSGAFDLSQSTYTEPGKASKVKEIIYRYLGGTGLLYSGV